MKTTDTKTPIILLLVSVATVLAVFSFLPAIPQDPCYHHFANDTMLVSIPNFYNVISNLGFVISGMVGLVVLKKHRIKSPMVWLLFIGMLLTGFGSAYYHYNPNNQTLVWDRLPMTLVFSSFFAELYAQYFNYKHALCIWLFTICVGIVSIAYWYDTEKMAHGDLRLYAIVQFLPMLLISIMCIGSYNKNKIIHLPLLATFVCYLAAKMFEHFDHTIFAQTHLIGGHFMKHVCASFATGCIVWMIKRRYEQTNKL